MTRPYTIFDASFDANAAADSFMRTRALVARVKELAPGARAGAAERAGGFSEALVEVGATVRVPKGAPSCGACPLQGVCLGPFAQGCGSL